MVEDSEKEWDREEAAARSLEVREEANSEREAADPTGTAPEGQEGQEKLLDSEPEEQKMANEREAGT